MWKWKKLNPETALSTLLHRRVAPVLCPPTTSATSFFYVKQNSPFRIFSSYFPRFEIEQNISSPYSLLSPSRVIHNPSVRSRRPDQIFSCFSSGSDSAGNLGCWNCNLVHAGTAPFLFCENCRCVQPVDHSVDYFQIFGLGRSYVIEDQNLELKYKNWQKKLHPDLVHTKTQKERDYAAEQSARVTDAYHTLTDNLRRSIYIMKLQGVDVDEEETISDPILLNEIMEIRESVEEAVDAHALNQIQTQLHEKLKCWSESFANAFQSRNFEEALASIRRMKYYKRASEEIIKKL